MKTTKMIAIVCLLACFGFTAQGQVIEKITYTRTAFDNSGDNLHKIANEFSDAVGNSLKRNYPAKVEDFSIEVTLTYNKINGYTLSYTCNIVRASIVAGNEDFQTHFDHRGGLALSQKEAQKNAFGQLKNSIPKLEQAFGEKYICFYPKIVSDGGYCVCETFVAFP